MEVPPQGVETDVGGIVRMLRGPLPSMDAGIEPQLVCRVREYLVVVEKGAQLRLCMQSLLRAIRAAAMTAGGMALPLGTSHVLAPARFYT